VATYEYRCDQDGVFDLTRPLGTAPESVVCPACGSEAQRIISLPTVRCATRNAYVAAIEHADKSRYEPEVVSRVPSAGAKRPLRMAQMTPALARLPRP